MPTVYIRHASSPAMFKCTPNCEFVPMYTNANTRLSRTFPAYLRTDLPPYMHLPTYVCHVNSKVHTHMHTSYANLIHVHKHTCSCVLIFRLLSNFSSSATRDDHGLISCAKSVSRVRVPRCSTVGNCCLFLHCHANCKYQGLLQHNMQRFELCQYSQCCT